MAKMNVTVDEGLLIATYAAAECGLSPRAIHDTGWLCKKPMDLFTCIQAQIELKEIVNAHYDRPEQEGTPPPYDESYREGGDGGKEWTEDDPEAYM
jgi:hypothetical protein